MNIEEKTTCEFIEEKNRKICEDLGLGKDFLDPNNATLSPDMIMELKKIIVKEKFKEQAWRQIIPKLKSMGFMGGTACFYERDEDIGKTTVYFPNLGLMFYKNYDFEYDCIKPVTWYNRLFSGKIFEDSYFKDIDEIDDFLLDVFYERKK